MPTPDPTVPLPRELAWHRVARPWADMRAALGDAAVGDDQDGEDPASNQRPERVATLLGKEAALFFPSGTMTNQVAVRVLTRPGDEAIVSRESHLGWHETGGVAANSGVQLTEIGGRGVFTAAEFLAACKPHGHLLHPPTTLVAIENTHNRMGGIVFPQDEVGQICAAAREHGIASYLDGARLWNAAVASGRPLAELAAPFDLTSVALSKGLGAPGGSLLAGSGALIGRCVRYRRMMGGAMRQVGIFSAAGLYALEHNLERLADDHANARLIGERLAASRRIVLDLDTVQTNILVFGLATGAPDSAEYVARAKERGVLLFAFGPHKVRAVTHLDVSRAQCEVAAEVLVEIAEGRAKPVASGASTT